MTVLMKILSIAMAFFAVLALLIAGCSQKAEESAQEPVQEALDTGVLAVESFPSQAMVYVDNELKGETPFTLYNMPVGTYNLAVKKEGYADFEKPVSIKVGKTEEVKATLAALAPAKAAAEKNAAEGPEQPVQKMPENASAAKFSRINLSMFAMYYDFENLQFAGTRADKSDLFSRKYDNYVHFTALAPAKINVINKPLSETKKEDCIFSDTAVAIVYAKQTLCVRTAEGNIIALGGSWQVMPDELEWALLS